MLSDLRSVIQEVNGASDLQGALDIIVDRVKSIMTTEVCSVYLLDEFDEHFVFMATRGLNEHAVGKVKLGPSEGLVGYVGERAEPINVQDVKVHPRNRYFPEIGEDDFHAFLGVPIIHQRQLLGVLVVQHKQRRRFDDSEEAFLVTLSAQLAGVIAHARATGVFSFDRDAAPSNRRNFSGMPGAPGVAIGTAVVVYPQAELGSVPDRRTRNIEREVAMFRTAVEETRKDLTSVRHRLSDRLQPEELDLFEAYEHMLDESAITGEVVARIEQGEWAQGALKHVITSHVATFDQMEDSYLRERGNDVRDLGIRVLARLQRADKRRTRFPKETILVGEQLAPADLALVPRGNLAGVVSMKGSMNSHLAILAEAMGIPTVMGLPSLPLEHIDGRRMVVDGLQGDVISAPSSKELTYFRNVAAEEARLVEGLEELKDEQCRTPDGHRTLLWVNTGLIADVARSIDRGAEGVGLYRTEIYFMMNEAFPTEEEQRSIYREHLVAFDGRPVTMRTLDVGGDKSLSYFPIEEENPFLGWRGIRVTLDHPEIFLSQIRAMIRANEGIDNDLRIMLPMVSSIAEIDEAQRLIAQCYREIIEEGVQVEMPDVGVMIEVPAAVYQARDIIRKVDFLSVGSNDLIQYMLAVDRNNARVAELFQEFHPAVLHALKEVVDAAHAERKPVGICGEMAGNPSAAILLMAMGFHVLSMNSPNLLMVKKALTTITHAKAKEILAASLKMDNAYLIKNFVDEEMHKAGLGQIVRSRQFR